MVALTDVGGLYNANASSVASLTPFQSPTAIVPSGQSSAAPFTSQRPAQRLCSSDSVAWLVAAGAAGVSYSTNGGASWSAPYAGSFNGVSCFARVDPRSGVTTFSAIAVGANLTIVQLSYSTAGSRVATAAAMPTSGLGTNPLTGMPYSAATLYDVRAETAAEQRTDPPHAPARTHQEGSAAALHPVGGPSSGPSRLRLRATP